MLNIIQSFYEKHPILFELITIPIEMLIGIPIGIAIARWTLGWFG